MAKSTQSVIRFISKLGLLLSSLDTARANLLISGIEKLIDDLAKE